MSLIRIFVLGLAAQAGLTAVVAAQPAQTAGSALPPVLELQKEVALAAAPFPPHVMFYAPYLTNADLGSDGNPEGPAFVVEEGTPHALIIVPVGAHTEPAHAPANAKLSGGSQ